MTDQSDIFAREEANRYFERNGFHRGFVTDYLISRLPRSFLAEANIAEFGIGGGQNLLLLKHYAKTVHGYDVSSKAIDCFKGFYSARPDAHQFNAQLVNLCEPFNPIQLYQVVIYGFFAYYVSDGELEVVKRNLLQALAPGGYLFVHDFLSRESFTKPDKRNSKLNVHKRTLPFWINHLSEFDLVDFRLFTDRSAQTNLVRDEFHTIDCNVTEDDSHWQFGGLFRRRS